jgi:hypothetical protein
VPTKEEKKMSDETNQEGEGETSNAAEEPRTQDQARRDPDAALVEERKTAAEETQADVTERQQQAVEDTAESD